MTRFRRKSATRNLVRIIPVWHNKQKRRPSRAKKQASWKPSFASVIEYIGQICSVARATYTARGQQRTTKQEEKNTVKTGVSRETWYIFLSKKISDRVVDDIFNVDHRRCEGVVWLELSSIKERHVIPLAAYTVKREIDVLGQGRARHGGLGRCQT